MNMRNILLVLAVVLAACSSTGGSGAALGSSGKSSSGAAGSSGSAGSGGSGASAQSNSGTLGSSSSSGNVVASCSNGTACGGNVVETWTATSSCLKVTGELDLSLFTLGCTSAPVTGSLEVGGSWIANSDGTYSDNTTTSGTEQFTLAASCLVISSTPVTCSGAASLLTAVGYSSLNCADAGGGGCTCSGTVHQAGGMGLLSTDPSTSGTYTTSNNVISESSGGPQYSYCVSGNTVTLTPQSASPTVTGTIVLQTSASHGSSSGSTSSSSSGANSSSGSSSGSTSSSSGSSTSTAQGPCDIYKSGGTPCVAAHSTVRALYGAYSKPLYQVRRASDSTTQDIPALIAGGAANSSAQDTFCSGTTCVITIIYDQTGSGNDLQYQGSGSAVGGNDQPASATGESVKLGANTVYSLYIKPGNSYWVNGSKSGIPTGAQPEGMYMVTSGTHYNAGCCFDYGNSEADRKADGAGAMDAINLSNITAWGTGAGSGPWVMADLEYGLFAEGDSKKNSNDPSQTTPFVTAVLKNNGTTEFTLRGADATTGSLNTYYKGALPAGWSPMKKQGAMVLGSGGDCCATNNNLSEGTFYEGSLVSGYPSDATESLVQANIVAAGYSK